MRALLAPFLCFIPAASMAAGCIDIKVSSEVRQTVTDARGRPAIRLVSAQKIGEGEELFYTVTATNTCDRAVKDVVLDNPVPEHMEYVADSAIGPAALVLFSVDGGFNFAPASALTVAVADGPRRKARPEDYTHIRWILRKPLQPQSVVFARFRAVVK